MADKSYLFELLLESSSWFRGKHLKWYLCKWLTFIFSNLSKNDCLLTFRASKGSIMPQSKWLSSTRFLSESKERRRCVKCWERISCKKWLQMSDQDGTPKIAREERNSFKNNHHLKIQNFKLGFVALFNPTAARIDQWWWVFLFIIIRREWFYASITLYEARMEKDPIWSLLWALPLLWPASLPCHSFTHIYNQRLILLTYPE